MKFLNFLNEWAGSITRTCDTPECGGQDRKHKVFKKFGSITHKCLHCGNEVVPDVEEANNRALKDRISVGFKRNRL